VAQGGTCVIRIGSFGPLSGVSTDLGNGVVNAVQMAIDEANEKGGVTLKDGRQCTFELVKGDDEATREGLAVVRRMIEEDKVDGIVGGVVSATILAVIDTIEKAGVPYINASGLAQDPQTIAENKYRFIFSASLTPTSAARRELITLLNASTVAFVNEGSDAGARRGGAEGVLRRERPGHRARRRGVRRGLDHGLFGHLRQAPPERAGRIYSETFGAL
jgi:ABC-type branched-subunit amino acid transport system substrate-binding protein